MAYLVAVRKRVEQELGVDDLVMIQHCVPLVAATIGEAWHLAMPRRDPSLSSAIEDRMGGDQGAVLEYLHLFGERVHLDDPLPGCIGNAVEIAADAHHAFMGDPSAHSRDESPQPIMGRTTDLWRASQARHRCRANHRCKVYGEAKATAVQGWKTFLHNHAEGIASMDQFVVPTLSFRLLYGLLILHHDRRQILWLGLTAHPTAEWISHQLTEAYGWKVAPRYTADIASRCRCGYDAGEDRR
jgi:hypothetical protein